MNSDETLAHDYLLGLKPANLIWEPNGHSKAPDFSINGTTGIEVRRLNKQVEINGAIEGIEQSLIPFEKKFTEFLESFHRPPAGHTWFVCIRVGRPIAPWRSMEQRLRREFELKQQTKNRDTTTFEFDDNLHFTFIAADKGHTEAFLLGSICDSESWGFVVSNIVRHVDLYAKEKSGKILPCKSQFSEWWLILIDHLWGTITPEDWRESCGHIKSYAEWDRIIVLSYPPDSYVHFVMKSGNYFSEKRTGPTG